MNKKININNNIFEKNEKKYIKENELLRKEIINLKEERIKAIKYYDYLASFDIDKIDTFNQFCEIEEKIEFILSLTGRCIDLDDIKNKYIEMKKTIEENNKNYSFAYYLRPQGMENAELAALHDEAFYHQDEYMLVYKIVHDYMLSTDGFDWEHRIPYQLDSHIKKIIERPVEKIYQFINMLVIERYEIDKDNEVYSSINRLFYEKEDEYSKIQEELYEMESSEEYDEFDEKDGPYWMLK